MRPLLLLLPFALAACGGSGTSVTIDAKSDDGDNSSVRMENGTLAIKGDGFQGSFKVPQIKVTAENFDMNGVKLYPGSEISNFHVAANDRAGTAKDEGKVTASFTSPAALATVQSWFRDKLTAKGFKYTAQGDGFAGTTEDGDPFTLDLTADGANKTRGEIEVRGS